MVKRSSDSAVPEAVRTDKRQGRAPGARVVPPSSLQKTIKDVKAGRRVLVEWRSDGRSVEEIAADFINRGG